MAQTNADLKQRLDAMVQVQQDTLKAYGAESAYENESHANSHGPRQTPSASSHGQDKEKARRSSLVKKIAQLEAANQVCSTLWA